MKKQNSLRVALLFGGAGYEHNISVKSAEHLQRELSKTDLDVFPVFISSDGSFYVPECRGASVREISAAKVPLHSVFPAMLNGKRGLISDSKDFSELDCAIPILHGDFGEDGRIQGLLDSARIPYVGCDTVCGALSSDKVYTKLVANSVGIPTVRGVSL